MLAPPLDPRRGYLNERGFDPGGLAQKEEGKNDP